MLSVETIVEESDLDGFLSDLDDILAEELALEAKAEAKDLEIFIEGADLDMISSIEAEIVQEEMLDAAYSSQEVESPELNLVYGDAEPEEVELPAAVVAAKTKVKAVKAAGSVLTSSKIRNKLGKDFIALTALDDDFSKLASIDHDTEFDKIVNTMANYVGDKTVNLFDYLNGGKLNNVTERAFEVLLADGMLTGGDEGNLIRNLLTKPYSIATARSQSNQIMQMFTDLKVGTRVGRGSLTINNDSLILAKVKTLRAK